MTTKMISELTLVEITPYELQSIKGGNKISQAIFYVIGAIFSPGVSAAANQGAAGYGYGPRSLR